MGSIIRITFNGGRGRMAIALDYFFPTDKRKLRKLLEVIKEDYGHEDELRAAIIRHCEERAKVLENDLKALANETVQLRTKAVEMQPDIDRIAAYIQSEQNYLGTCHVSKATKKMYQEQLKNKKKALSERKKLQRDYSSSSRIAERRFRAIQQAITKLKENAEVVRNA